MSPDQNLTVDNVPTSVVRPKLIAITYFLFLLGPVIACLCVSAAGYKFSLAAQRWQKINQMLVFGLVVTYFFFGVIAAIATERLLSKFDVTTRIRFSLGALLSSTQRFFVIMVALLSVIGLYKSFPGTIFTSSYVGPTFAWLGVGAWSVIYLICLALLFSGYMHDRRLTLGAIFCIQLSFIPPMLCGSRIEMLSMMFGLLGYIWFIQGDGKKYRLTLFSVLISGVLAVVVGKIRYASHDAKIAFDNMVPVNVSGDMLYLSTFGDIGVSVFQVVGIVKNNPGYFIGLGACEDYLIRLIPGFLNIDRPSDFFTRLPEPIGGGTLHSIGEGYLIGGALGVSLVAIVIGCGVGVSVAAAKVYSRFRSPFILLIFLLPWIAIIRGGWYQFFAYVKIAEVVIALWICLFLINRIEQRCGKKSGIGGFENIFL